MKASRPGCANVAPGDGLWPAAAEGREGPLDCETAATAPAARHGTRTRTTARHREEAQALAGPSVWARLRPRWRWFGNGPIPEIRADGGEETTNGGVQVVCM